LHKQLYTKTTRKRLAT